MTGKPAWLDDPELTRIDFAAIQATGDATQAAMQQAMIQRNSPDGAATLEQFATPPAPDQSRLTPPVDPAIQAEIERARALDAALEAGNNLPPSGGVQAAGEPSATDPNAAGGSSTQLDPNAPQPDAPTPVPEGMFRVPVPSQDGTTQYVDITPEQAAQLLVTNSWLQSRPKEVLNQWGAIERGEAAALSHEQVAAYQAWVAAGSPSAQPVQPQRPDLSLADPEIARYVQQLESRVSGQAGQPASVPPAPSYDRPPQQFQPQQFQPAQFGPQTTPQYAPLPQQQVEQEIQRRQQLDVANTAISAKYGLTPEQLSHLQNAVVQSNIIPRIIMEQRTVSPTGVVLHEPSFGSVVSQAMETVIAQDPTLRPIFEEHVYQQRLARDNASNATVQSKKALAGSIASAAPAAIPAVAKDPVAMNQMETRDAIAQFLQTAQANGTFGN